MSDALPILSVAHVTTKPYELILDLIHKHQCTDAECWGRGRNIPWFQSLLFLKSLGSILECMLCMAYLRFQSWIWSSNHHWNISRRPTISCIIGLQENWNIVVLHIVRIVGLVSALISAMKCFIQCGILEVRKKTWR